MTIKLNFVLLASGLALAGCGTISPNRQLGYAAISGNVKDVAASLDKGAPIDQRYVGEYSALDSAAYYGHTDVVKLLLDRGASIDTRMRDQGPTALSYAAMKGHPKTMEVLISKGADIQKAIDGLEPMANASAADNDGKAGIKLLMRLQGKKEPAEPASLPVQPVSSALASLSPNYSNAPTTDDYAVIVGIEKYPDLPAATYAERDAVAAKSFIRALGVPERNIMVLIGTRATKTGMEKMVEAWLPNNVSEKSRVYFYYSGHGAPDTKAGDAYLVPSDGDPQYLAQTGYPLKRLYAKLGELKAKSVLVTLDSCFSGAGGRSVLPKGTRPLVGKVDMALQAKGKLSVISASAGDQISGTNEEAGYGLFTYNLLQGLNGAAQDAQGQVTLKSLYAYLNPRVQDDARRGNRDQTPQLQSAGEDLILRSK